ncbi:MAG: lytic murein transglycosylase [Mesorhizobium sp.]|nr:MAG: lytic murein transglycosylase [Mesorhizobium sp.]
MTLRSYTPLCPAGHLPLKGGDWMSHRLSPISNLAEWAARSKLPISPLEGEMAGRPEGGGLALSLGKACFAGIG